MSDVRINFSAPPRNQMTAEQRIEQIKELNRARAKRHYDANKVKIGEQRKKKRDAIRALVAAAGPPPNLVQIAAAVKEIVPAAVVLPAAPAAPAGRGRGRLVRTAAAAPAANAPLLKKDVIAALKAQEKDPNGNTHRTDVNNLSSLERILNITNFRNAFENADTVIAKIENATQKNNDEFYGPNTKRGFIQTLLKVLDNSTLKDVIKISNQNRLKLIQQFKLYKDQSQERTEEKRVKPVLDYDVYLKKIEEVFGRGSKQHIIADLYSFGGFRDDLKELYIVPSKQDVIDENKNYIVVPASKSNCQIIIHKYKTAAEYGTKYVNVPKDLSVLIKNFMKEKKLDYGDFLFGASALSSYISNFNKAAGFPKITINVMRSMLESKLDNSTPEKRLANANLMGHSTGTQKLVYKTNVTKEMNFEPQAAQKKKAPAAKKKKSKRGGKK